ncbi:hypothetical protein RHGRI_034685 [Rhododendron griersonianum]|uniref:Adaptor protein ClpS core domain-containing protein n=1 Tax=Rhododendron griersonianum TaxID=479676 RepID=A0AAV6I4X3_9ERIC|nr:hypothetical protein RHGRI_034685 [Rhododendron griersonianum]
MTFGVTLKVGAIVSYHKIPLKQVLVIFDDLDLPFAKLRLLPKGGHGGHNGMRSVIDHFKGSKDFPRLRIGIGRPPGKMNPVSFVMRAFNKQERQELDFAFQNGIEAVRILLLEGDKYALHKQCTNRSFFWSVPAAAAGKGGGVLDIPTREKTKPGREAEFGVRKSRKISPPYRVMLHNDDYNKREYVVQVLMKVIPGMTVDNAVNIMQEAHINGLSVVIICAQADAEEHCTQLRGNGLRSSIEPASGGC